MKTCPFWGPLIIKNNVSREQLLQNNHKYGSIPKDFNNNIYKSISSPTKTKNASYKHKLNSVRFEEPYNHINTMDIYYYYTHPIVANDNHRRGYD